MFAEFLLKPIASGGVGMHAEDVTRITKNVFTLVRYSKDVEHFREEMHHDDMFLHQRKFIDHVLIYITTETRIQMSSE